MASKSQSVSADSSRPGAYNAAAVAAAAADASYGCMHRWVMRRRLDSGTNIQTVPLNVVQEVKIHKDR